MLEGSTGNAIRASQLLLGMEGRSVGVIVDRCLMVSQAMPFGPASCC